MDSQRAFFTYKTLLVFVTEIYATLKSHDNTEDIEVSYKMTEVERQVCLLFEPLLENYLNDLFDGLVTFEFDTYFTTIPITRENILLGSDSSFHNVYTVYTQNLPELQDMLGNYRSVMTTFCLNDYNSKLGAGGGGSAGAKYANMHMESIFKQLIINDTPIEWLLDKQSSKGYWESLLQFYMHELTHTMELSCGAYGYHAALKYYSDQLPPGEGIYEIEIMPLYLFGQANVEGMKVGLPYSFWEGYKTLTYVYNGATGNCDQETVTLPYEENGGKYLIVPVKEGYSFGGWFRDEELNFEITSPSGMIIIQEPQVCLVGDPTVFMPNGYL